MYNATEAAEKIIYTLGDAVWGTPALLLLLGTGIFMSVRLRFFQVTKFKQWMGRTAVGIIKDRNITRHTGDKTTSQFQSFCIALAATMGTGNIVGVSVAIAAGGAGSVFWMWAAAFFGMMTKYSENVLGIFYRVRKENGEWAGGAMYCLSEGLNQNKYLSRLGKILAAMFSVFTVLASFGMGNLSQVNSVSGNMLSAFGVEPIVTGTALTLAVGYILLGGTERLACVVEKLVPLMAVAYAAGSLIIIAVNRKQLPDVVCAIFSGAFGAKPVGGAAAGLGVSTALSTGLRRGVFSNEAGLGSSAIAHSGSNVTEPVQQGMWGIFEVFADTFAVCTLTALSVLSSGTVEPKTGAILCNADASSLVGAAFSSVFGSLGSKLTAVCILFFAFSSVLGWSRYGSVSWEYLFGDGSQKIYRLIFIGLTAVGSVAELRLVWGLSDIFNGLMALPNLIGLLLLSPVTVKLTREYQLRNAETSLYGRANRTPSA